MRVVLPTSVLPTEQPSSTPAAPAATRIQFKPGATQSITHGSLQPGQETVFVLEAQQGQMMMASLDSPNQDIGLSIAGKDGTVLLASSPVETSFIGSLLSSQDYYFHLKGGASGGSFTLSVIVAVPIRFASGADKASFTGRTADGLAVTYSAYALQGQTMDVRLDVAGDSAALTIWGLGSGEPYVRAQNGIRNYSLVLPASQPYMIEVVPQAGQVVDYTLTVQIR